MGEFHFRVGNFQRIYARQSLTRHLREWNSPGQFWQGQNCPYENQTSIAFSPVSGIIRSTEADLMHHTWRFHTYIYSGGL
jgi:hypothetical protein